MSTRRILSVISFVGLLVGLFSSPGLAMAGDGPAASAPPDFTLRLGEFAFDPLQGEPALPAGWDRSAGSTRDLHLVQFDGPIPADGIDRLREAGLEPVQYVYPNTYIVWGRAADRGALLGSRSIRWSGDFAPAYRVQPQWRNRREEILDVNVLIYRGAGADTVVETLAKLGGVPGRRMEVNDRFELAGFRIPGERMQAAASVPGVYSIQEMLTDWASRAEVSAQINAGNVDGSNLAFPGYQAWLAGLGLDGSGVTVAEVDEGIDFTHPDLLASELPCTGDTCAASWGGTHGTHVAGIIAGDGSSAELDDAGFLRGLGVAPSAGLVDQSWRGPHQLPGGVLDLMTDSSRNGASVSNNSWGLTVIPRGYDLNSMLVDTGVRDADPYFPGRQSLAYVQAINNGDGGTTTLGVPDEAKNIIAVGSTNALNFPVPDVPHTQNLDIDSISNNSGHGPAMDGRMVPHIVAPGCYVDSTYPDLGGGEGHNWREVCGTSMAAPQVSGAAALFIEYWRGLPGYVADPSPAMVKASLLAVTHDLEGNYDADGNTLGHRPDSKQGWGRLNLPAVIDPPAGSVIYYDQERIFEESSEEWLREVMPVDPAKPMRIMLVWTDAPGHGLGGSTPALSNDLDLVVEAGGNTYYGNYFGVDGYSATGGVADTLNNAEGVFIELPPADLLVRVVATNIPADGVPGFNDETDQDFALVCHNCAFTTGFALEPDPVTHYVCAPDDAPFAIEVEQHGAYAEPVTLSLTGLPAGATAAFDVNPVAPGGVSTLTLGAGTATTGDYMLMLDGDTVDLNRYHPIYYRLRTDVPVPALLTLPANGAIDVFPQPTLEWDPAPWAWEYVVEVATDAAFTEIFYTGRTRGTSLAVGEILEQGVTYHWRVRASNVCGFGAFSTSSSFTTEDMAPVLLVDDDWDYWGDYQSEFTDAMIALGVGYDVWDVYNTPGLIEPDYSTLAHYDNVIWWSGNEDVYAGPEELTEYELEHWLIRDGGCFFISSPDYILNRGGVSDFMVDYLGVGAVTEDTEMGAVTPAGAVFSPIGTSAITLKNVSQPGDYSDSISPDLTAELAFSGDMGDAGINKDGAFYRSAFMGYSVHRLFSSSDLEDVLGTFLGWCDGLPALDGDSDGVLNGADCAPGDPDAWTAPSEVTDLMLSKDVTEFTWSQPVSGSGAVYDVIRSLDHDDFWNATCVASGVDGPPTWGDDDPAPGEIFFYQVRARGDCGMTSLGSYSDGTQRHGTACN